MLDANGWILIIAAVALGIDRIVSLVLSYKRDQAKIARDQLVADRVEEVKKETVKNSRRVRRQTDNVAKEVKVVKSSLAKATEDHKANEQAAIEGVKKIKEVVVLAETIHKETNSNLTEVKEELKAAREEIKALQSQVLKPTNPPP